MALRGTVVPQAVSSAQAAQVRCEAPQMPQARGVTTRPACGSLSRRMTSKAAEQLRLGPGVGDDAVLNVDPDVEIAFDAADRRDVQRLHRCSSWLQILPDVVRQTTKMSSSAQAGAAPFAAAVSFT